MCICPNSRLSILRLTAEGRVTALNQAPVFDIQIRPVRVGLKRRSCLKLLQHACSGTGLFVFFPFTLHFSSEGKHC